MSEPIVRNFRTELFPWQQRAVEKLLNIRVGALYMEQGTGKTRVALEMIGKRGAKIDRVLWLCPCSIIDSIKADITRHCDWDKSRLWVYGIESLSSSIRLYDKLDAYIADGSTMLVVDESNLVKNNLAIRTRNITRLAGKCKYRIILNGTPISRNMADLFSQWYILDWRILGYRSFWSFAANHLEYDKYRPGRIVRAHNVDYITSKIAPYTYQVTREECMTLPPKLYYENSVNLTADQRDHYEFVADEMIEQLDERKSETIYRMFSALQAVISGRWVKDDGLHISTYPMFDSPSDNPRMVELMDILEDVGQEKAIIFCKYSSEIRDICAILGDRAIAFYGAVPQRRRQETVERFSGDAQYLVANKTCAGYGLNLQFCRNVIYYSNDWDLATRMQSEDRVHRIGQSKDVRIWDIYAYRTLDEKILDCLSRKKSLVGSLREEIDKHKDIRDIVREWIKGVREDDNESVQR